MPSDMDLISRIRVRDAEALEALLARHEAAVHRHLLRIVHDASAAEDLAQEVFLRVWMRAGQWRAEGPVKGWLLRIATNLALNHLRALRRRPQQPLEGTQAQVPGDDENLVPAWMIDASSLGPEALLEAAERHDLLRRGIDSLPEEKREVLRLVLDEEMSVRDVAGALDIPEGTVKSRLYHARLHLARRWQALETEGEDNP